jgi:hypothetical protein
MMNRLLLEYISKLLIKESSPASQQAKQMGLSYMGFGQWGIDGKVTHKSADKDGTMLVVYTPKTEEIVDEPSKDTKKRTSYSDYPEIQPEELNAASLADKVREGIVAPGNDFSKYQEAVSIFIAKYIVDNPDASDQDIMERIVLLDCGSKLLTKDVKSTLPKKYTAEFNELKQTGVFSTCAKDYKDDQHKARFATMIFAKKKAELMISGIEKAKLVSPRIDSFSGDQDSLSSLATLVKTSTGKIYSPEGNELKKDEVIESISGFGTSKFPADTALIAIDKFGNMVFIGYSDKKDLNAIINNSTVSSEINSHIRVLDSLLNREIMDQERYDKLAGELYTLDKEYNNIESELKVATLDPANELVNISNNTPEQLTELVSRAKRLSGGKTPDKYLKKLTDAIGKAYNNKSSKVFKLWEPLLQQAGWDGTTMPTEEQMLAAFAFKSFDVLNNEDSGGWNIYPVSRGENTLTKEAQELLFRLMVPDGSPQKKEFVEKIGVIRDRSLQILAQAREELNEVTVGLEDGSSIKLGTYLDAIQAWRALHLDMGEYEGSLVMAAEDIIVGAADLIRCLRGADSYEDFAKTLDISTKRIKDKSYGTVTGQNVEIFSINPEGKKVKVGTRSIRSKDGILGKLQTTYNYHPEFQNCLRQFVGTGKLDENFNLKSSKILLEYLSSILGENIDNSVSQQAQKLGLVKMPGFGLYGKEGDSRATHRSVRGKLTLTKYGLKRQAEVEGPGADHDNKSSGSGARRFRRVSIDNHKNRLDSIINDLRERKKAGDDSITDDTISRAENFKSMWMAFVEADALEAQVIAVRQLGEAEFITRSTGGKIYISNSLPVDYKSMLGGKNKDSDVVTEHMVAIVEGSKSLQRLIPPRDSSATYALNSKMGKLHELITAHALLSDGEERKKDREQLEKEITKLGGNVSQIRENSLRGVDVVKGFFQTRFGKDYEIISATQVGGLSKERAEELHGIDKVWDPTDVLVEVKDSGENVHIVKLSLKMYQSIHDITMKNFGIQSAGDTMFGSTLPADKIEELDDLGRQLSQVPRPSEQRRKNQKPASSDEADKHGAQGDGASGDKSKDEGDDTEKVIKLKEDYIKKLQELLSNNEIDLKGLWNRITGCDGGVELLLIDSTNNTAQLKDKDTLCNPENIEIKYKNNSISLSIGGTDVSYTLKFYIKMEAGRTPKLMVALKSRKSK